MLQRFVSVVSVFKLNSVYTLAFSLDFFSLCRLKIASLILIYLYDPSLRELALGQCNECIISLILKIVLLWYIS